jgi:hypothetical protein
MNQTPDDNPAIMSAEARSLLQWVAVGGTSDSPAMRQRMEITRERLGHARMMRVQHKRKRVEVRTCAIEQ